MMDFVDDFHYYRNRLMGAESFEGMVFALGIISIFGVSEKSNA
jgi:hypothetical protein